MDPVTIAKLSIEGIGLLVKAYEAAEVGNTEEAMAYLEKVANRSLQARTRWENATKGEVFD